MATSRTSVPPVNLKDRIAALQQRKVSPTSNASEPSPVITTTPGRLAGGSLKDKIANFERAGAVPVPKGRFGSSAPLNSDGTPRNRGELYGNRVPGLARPTVDASLLVRKRTVSSSDAPSHLRPNSPEIPPVPPLVPSLTGGSVTLGSTPADRPTTRRIVSDILPQKSSTLVLEPLVDEDVEGGVVIDKEPEAATDALVEVPLETNIVDTPATLAPAISSQEDEAPAILETPALPRAAEVDSSPASLSPSSMDDDKSDASTIKVEDVTLPVTRSETGVQEPSETIEKVVEPKPAIVESEPFAAGDDERPSADVPAAEDVIAAAEELTIGSESDTASVLGNSTASSDSVLNTPSDHTSFPVTSAPLNTEKESLGVEENKDGVNPPNVDTVSPLSSIPSGLRNSLNSRQSVISQISVGGESLALDAKDAIIVTGPPQIVSPTVTRAVLVPAPTSRPALSPVPSPPPVAATEQAALERRTTQKSFRAVVHHKVRETSASEPVPPVVAPKRSPGVPPQTPTAQRIRNEGLAEPQSPGFSDLLSLVADAALLEEQLSSSRSPAKKALPTPTVNIQAAISEPETAKPATPSSNEHLSPVAPIPPRSQEPSPSSESSHSYQMPGGSPAMKTAHVRARTSSEQPSSPPRGSGRHFSSLRVGKQNMPGAYPRSSVCSEVSEESSVLVSRAPSPPLLAYDTSDASSVRSSTKSWKSSKKGLGRASSWLFRGKSKNQTVMEEQDARQDASEHSMPSPSLLAPIPPTPPPKSPAGRPMSWMSMSSAASGDVAELFDAFPSVPGGSVNRATSMHYPTANQLPGQQRGQGPTQRPHTMYGAPRK